MHQTPVDMLSEVSFSFLERSLQLWSCTPCSQLLFLLGNHVSGNGTLDTAFGRVSSQCRRALCTVKVIMTSSFCSSRIGCSPVMGSQNLRSQSPEYRCLQTPEPRNPQKSPLGLPGPSGLECQKASNKSPLRPLSSPEGQRHTN